MAMFNNNLTSSISGWFSNTFQANPDEEPTAEIPDKKDNDDTAKPQAESQQVEQEQISENKHDDAVKEKDVEESEDQAGTNVLDLDTEQMQKKLTEETQKMVSSAKMFGSYLFGVATEASKKVSVTVNETAQNLKKTVETTTILGDLNREQKEFIRQKREKQGDGAVPPWCGYQEEETMKKQILALSTDTRNFLRSPPSGVQFNFDFETMFPIAKATLKEDENLNKMRFTLVPTKVKEEVFWRNYFYRVSLIKQSAQLSTLAEMQKPASSSAASEGASSGSSTSSMVMVGSTATGTISRSSSSKSLNKSDAGSGAAEANGGAADINQTEDLPAAEFVSDAFDPSTLNPDDLEREMRELGMDGETGGIPEWEEELQKELQDYEVVGGGDKDEMWEKEIDDMLSADASTS